MGDNGTAPWPLYNGTDVQNESILNYMYLNIALAVFLGMAYIFDFFMWKKFRTFRKRKVVHSSLVLAFTIATVVLIWQLDDAVTVSDEQFKITIGFYACLMLAYQLVDLYMLSKQIVIIKDAIPAQNRKLWKKNVSIVFGIFIFIQLCLSIGYFIIIFSEYVGKWPDLVVSLIVLFFDSILYAGAAIYTSVKINSTPKHLKNSVLVSDKKKERAITSRKRQLLIFSISNTITKFLFYLSLNSNELFGSLTTYLGGMQFLFQVVDILCNVVALRYSDACILGEMLEAKGDAYRNTLEI
eukprot:TRINITY_DN16614_c0_g1_i1.p1 TRINITY_DN16614_c0_g1~~TRINITY_DN16614_c0_g1_i1.p1  ORF type:complete len:297 (+),score=69.94 TRINITY_DN16614_c0_g1_i1:95-985(+)